MNAFFFDIKNYLRFVGEYAFTQPDTRIQSYKHFAFWLVYSTILFPFNVLFNALFFVMDDIFYPKIRRVRIHKPIFIIGNFRTGTTFLHRLLLHDTEQFTASTGGEIYLSPSYSARQIIKGIKVVDSLFAAPIKRFIYWLDKRIFENIRTHKVSRTEPEEDESLFLHSFASSFLTFASAKFFSYEKYYYYDDRISEREKKRDMNYYAACIRRHMYYHKNAQYYVSKSPSFTCRYKSILRLFPDARFIYMLRDPLEVLPSLTAMFSDVWSFLQKKDTVFPHRDFMLAFSRHWMISIPKELEHLPKDQLKFVKYSDMTERTGEFVRDIYKWLNIPLSDEFARHLAEAEARMLQHKQADYPELRKYFKNEEIRDSFAQVYAQLEKKYLHSE